VYLLSFGADPDLQDSKGLTPLHLAVKTSEDNRTTRTIKQLLVKGADRHIRDKAGKRAVDFVNEFKFQDSIFA